MENALADIIGKMVRTPLKMVGWVSDMIRSGKADSLVDYTKTARVEPITMVDEDVMHQDFMPEIMQSLNSIFTGYYLQAVAISMNVGKIDTIKMLDKVNPERSPSEAAGFFVENLVSEESYEFGLPFSSENLQPSMEASRRRQEEAGADETPGSRDNTKIMNEVANLSVGKMVDVHLKDEGQEITIPVAVRLIVSGIDSRTLIHILADGSKDKSLRERWHGWRSGQLEFWRDLILCQDLIDEHRRTLMNDSSGVYASTRSRGSKNKLAGIFSMQPSIATASNLVVISKENAKELERETGHKLKDFKKRERIFDETYIMLMVVVDPAWEQVIIYHRGIEVPTELSIKEMKSANKGNGPDVGEILKAYQLGQAPTI